MVAMSPTLVHYQWWSKAGSGFQLSMELDKEHAPLRAAGEVGPGRIRTTSFPRLPSGGWDCAALRPSVDSACEMRCSPRQPSNLPLLLPSA